MNDSTSEQIFKRLGQDDGLPVDAIRAANANRTAMVPFLLREFEHPSGSEDWRENALFLAFHLLGQWREASAYRPLVAFLRRPEAGQILDDAMTATSHRVMAAVFDGDPTPLYELVLDPAADEFLRGRACETIALLSWRHELPREEAARFLHSCYDSLQPQECNFVWQGWQSAVAMLGLTELRPLVKQAFDREFIHPSWLDFKDFEDDLRHGIAGVMRPSSERSGEFDPFGNVIDELSDWAAFKPKEKQTQRADTTWYPSGVQTPIVNPFRHVGRNDPCPCGSGKKFKKCCLGKVDAAPPALPPLEAVDEFDVFENDDAFDEFDTPTMQYDPLVAPDPEQWLALDEQERIDIVAEYHRIAGFDDQKLNVHATIHAVVENQIAEGDTLPVRRIAERLMSEGLDRHDTIHAIGSVLAEHMFDLVHDVRADDDAYTGEDLNRVYFAALERLTAKEWLRSG